MDFEEFIDYLAVIAEDIIFLFDSVPVAGTTLWRVSIGAIFLTFLFKFMPMFNDDEEN